MERPFQSFHSTLIQMVQAGAKCANQECLCERTLKLLDSGQVVFLSERKRIGRSLP